METHAFVDRAGAELVSDLHVLSQQIFACNTRADVQTRLIAAASYFTDRIVRIKGRLREIAVEINEAAA